MFPFEFLLSKLSQYNFHQSKRFKLSVELPREILLMIMNNLGPEDTARMGTLSKTMREVSIDSLIADPNKLVELMWIQGRCANNVHMKGDFDKKFTAILEQIRNSNTFFDVFHEMTPYWFFSSYNEEHHQSPFKAMRDALKTNILNLIAEKFERTVTKMDANGLQVEEKDEDLSMKLQVANLFQRFYWCDYEFILALKTNSAMKKAFSIGKDADSFDQVYVTFILSRDNWSLENLLQILNDAEYFLSRKGFSVEVRQMITNAMRNMNLKQIFNINPSLKLLNSLLTAFYYSKLPESLSEFAFDENLVLELMKYADFCDFKTYMDISIRFHQPRDFLKSICLNLKTCLRNTKKTSFKSFKDFLKTTLKEEDYFSLARFIFDKEVMELLVDKSIDDSGYDIGDIIHIMNEYIPYEAIIMMDEIFTEEKAKKFSYHFLSPHDFYSMMLDGEFLPKNLLKQLFANLKTVARVMQYHVSMKDYPKLLYEAEKVGNPNNVIEKVFLTIENIQNAWKKSANQSEFAVKYFMKVSETIKKYSPKGFIKQLFAKGKILAILLLPLTFSDNDNTEHISFIRFLIEEGVPIPRPINRHLMSVGGTRAFFLLP